jgi:uncharacterized protein
MERYILDTNLFFNMEAGLGLGQKTEDVIKTMQKVIAKLKESKKAEFYMSPRIVEEFLSFFEDKEQSFLKEFLSVITIKSPDLQKIDVSGFIVYQLVDDVRSRAYRGLTVAEEEIQKAGRMMMGKETLSKKDFEMSIGPVVKTFRDRYRQATRFGFIDSLGDLDTIMLAKELDGYVVSTDEGVMKWGRIFGVKEMPASVFGPKMLAELS